MSRWRMRETNTRIPLLGPCASVSVLIAGLAVMAALSGCASQPMASSTSAVPTTSSPATTTITTAAPTTTTAAPTTTTAEASSPSSVAPTTTAATTAAVSADSLAYASELGGTPHEGETLYFVVGANVETEQEAQTLVDEATPLFGDMQSYFIVQRSDNLEGMKPGWWVVIEAYRAEPSQENIDFDRRGFPGAYVTQATVRTADPIPVYEDMVGGD